MIEMELFEIRIDETTQEQLIILKEISGERHLHIVIGLWEAQAIQIKISGYEVPRPLTHDLLNNLIFKMGGTLEKVLVNNLESNTFFARLFIRTENGLIDVDSRPSDAIALAVRAKAPIFVEEEVLEKVQHY